ncbi:MAG: flagellar hook capping FlgD N-terminal domain-containing protein [Oscillospiraceae bacterium]
MADLKVGMDMWGTNTTAGASGTNPIRSNNPNAGKTELDMSDFLTLMVKQFQNQDIDNAASTSDMMNQMVQMSVMQAVTNITQATTMLYSAGLVGKEVTVGAIGEDGKLAEVVGTVTGTGTYGGQPVIFVNGKTYYLNEIMAVGKLPPKEEVKPDPKPDEKPDEKPKPEDGTTPV